MQNAKIQNGKQMQARQKLNAESQFANIPRNLAPFLCRMTCLAGGVKPLSGADTEAEAGADIEAEAGVDSEAETGALVCVAEDAVTVT